ncbi:tyrosine-type recombinase/integrase [Candidatus Woesearchaeota archaeon]|nr:tyrosine-type recombinase/integrase [Candidatus Woesearchaeota archaeon]
MGLFDGLHMKTRIDKKKGLQERFRNFVLEMRVRNFSSQTIDSYLYHNNRFLEFVKKEQRSVTSCDIKDYLNHLALHGAGPRTINMAISSLRSYYESYLGKRLFKNIKRPKIPKDMDPVLSQDEILSMIHNTKSLKHRLLIELLYSSGMRVGECVKVKVEDIQDNIVFVRKGKGKKDRFTIASRGFVDGLRRYLLEREMQSEFLFDNGLGGHITIRAAEEIVKKAAKKAGIKRRVYPHLLRACFTTHLLEKGVEDYKVQRLMGHSNLKTTMGYNRLRTDDLKKIRSPLD